MIKSPLRYAGGKSKLVKHLYEYFPTFKNYREPFVGGGSVLFYTKQMQPKKNYWINDVYTHLTNFWVCIRDNKKQVVETVHHFSSLYSHKELYTFLKSNFDTFTPIECCAAFFILNRITFSGLTLSGGYSEKCGRFTHKSIERLYNCSYLLDNVLITNGDFSSVISPMGTDTFIFCDPPYCSNKKSLLYGKRGNYHENFDHDRLYYELHKSNHTWMVTYDDSPYIRNLYSNYTIIDISTNYSMKQGLNVDTNEIVIVNYLKNSNV